MQDIKIWEEKIKEKRKKTSFHKFFKEICSWSTSTFHRNEKYISRYPSTNRSPKLVSNKEFNENRDELTNYGFDFNENKTFFQNFEELFKKVPISPTISQMAGENTDFSDTIVASSNSYLSNIVVEDCKNIFYSFQVINHSEDVFNSVRVIETSNVIYFSSIIYNSFKIFYSKNIIGSNNIWFSNALQGCSECIFCDNLENKSYCIKNKQYEKNEYLKEKQEILKDKNNFLKYYKEIKDIGKNIGSTNSIGRYIIKSENVENGFIVSNTRNGRNVVFVGIGENFYDLFDCGMEAKDFYGVCGGGTYSNNVYCSTQIETCSKMYYSFYCNNCSFCLGCIGLKNKSFCILNKQYSKEEWYELANKIFSQMDKDGILGDFFPGELNPFYFNDTMAYLIDDSFTKEEVEKEGYMWRDEKIKVDIPENAEIVEMKNLSSFQGFDSNGNWFINPEIMKKVIQDENGNIYKIVPMEYEFLMKHGLPLPEIHWLDRIKLGFKFK
ncbi:MAG: hypothetical protein PHE25_05500 [Candidatus Gracilibacteria bacterium]|nr:hypothetical protein [Candidatus Gracilibacteria bacterium]